MEKGGGSCNHTFVEDEGVCDGSHAHQEKLLNSKADFLTAIEA
jgi:hypothetical protein